MKLKSRKNVILIVILALSFVCFSCGGRKGKYSSDGTYEIEISMEGGSGKAYIFSPVTVTVTGREIKARLVWSSKNYDYMIVDGVKYIDENPEGESTFTIPVKSLDEPLKVIGDTVAMSTPYEIEYVIYWEGKGAPENSSSGKNSADASSSDKASEAADPGDLETSGIDYSELKQTGVTELKYAKRFTITECGEYHKIHIDNSGDYLLVPENSPVPDNIPEDVTVLKQPFDRTYLVSTSAFDLVRQLNVLDKIRLLALPADEWYVDEAREALSSGAMLYAGKYKAPDYELILSEGANLAVENTMIYHEPEVREKLIELGIPVIIEASSYEEHPLGRLEWIKLYGLLYDCEEAAEAYFDSELKTIEPVMQKENTGKTVAFFHVTANGLINVRKPGDYIAKMIGLSGGIYVPGGDPEDDESNTSTTNMQMEDFYAAAKDADIIIYNSTIGGEIKSIDELLGKNSFFADFKAVKEKNVYCTSRNFFQQSTGVGRFMQDLDAVLSGQTEGLNYLNKVE